jgi:Sap, sulfolipid-1-addressing protein
MNILTVLPMAFVMVAGPQILSAIFLATSEDWRRNSAAFLAGAALSISLFVGIAYVVGRGINSAGGDDTLDILVLVLLVAAAIHAFLTRKTAEPPKWMGKLQAATPKVSFGLGFLLLGVFPTDILTSWAVGTYLSNHGDPWWHLLPFLVLTLVVLLLGRRGQAFMPKARDWMNANSWIVNEIVIAFFIGVTANSLAG